MRNPLLLAAATLCLSAALPPEDPIEIQLTTLSEFDFAPGMELPKNVAELNNIRVIFEAYMHTDTEDDTTTFFVVGNACQCAGVPLVNHFVEITLDSGITDHRPGLITFEGLLDVSEEIDDLGLVESLYRLDGNFF